MRITLTIDSYSDIDDISTRELQLELSCMDDDEIGQLIAVIAGEVQRQLLDSTTPAITGNDGVPDPDVPSTGYDYDNEPMDPGWGTGYDRDNVPLDPGKVEFVPYAPSPGNTWHAHPPPLGQVWCQDFSDARHAPPPGTYTICQDGY